MECAADHSVTFSSWWWVSVVVVALDVVVGLFLKFDTDRASVQDPV